MRKIVFEKEAHREFTNWELEDARIFRKIAELIMDIQHHPFKGIGKPEALKYHLKGCWSRRINQKHRLIYRISPNDEIHIIACKGHYD